MKISNLSIKNSFLSWMFIAILAIAAMVLFSNLGPLEYPAFTLKNAMLLHHITLAAIIIALGMFADNAIVILKGILVSINTGQSKTQAAINTVKQNQWSLLAATVIAIIAFSIIGLSSRGSNQFMASLFPVLGYSLFLSCIAIIALLYSTTQLKHQTSLEAPLARNEDPRLTDNQTIKIVPGSNL